jgi:hypothetical protein
MSKSFEHYSFILVYPSEADDSSEMMFSNDFSKSLIDEGISQLSQKAKSITEIFRKKE